MINGWIIGGTPSAISHWVEMEKKKIFLADTILYCSLFRWAFNILWCIKGKKSVDQSIGEDQNILKNSPLLTYIVVENKMFSNSNISIKT